MAVQVDLQRLWAYALRVSCEPDKIAQMLGLEPGNRPLRDLMCSMAVSGYLISGNDGSFRAGKRPPDGSGNIVTIAGGPPGPPAGDGEAPRPPSAVIPGAEEDPGAPQAEPDAEPERPPPPDGFRYARARGDALEVVDDRTDRIAKAELIPFHVGAGGQGVVLPARLGERRSSRR